VGQVLEDVERTLVTRRPAPSPVTAAAQVLAGPSDSWQASLIVQVGETRTERRFQAESCAAIASAVALILAVAVDDAPESATGGEAPPLLKIQPVPDRPPRFLAMLSALLDWDTLPSPPASGLELAGARKWSAGRWRLGAVVGAEFFPSHRPAQAPYIGQVAGTFWMLGLSGRGCFGFTARRVEVGPCLGAELVGMHTSAASAVGSYSPLTVQDQTELWLSLLGSLAAAWNFSPTMDLVLRADLTVPTTRKVFGIQGDSLWDYVVSRAAVRGAVGLAYRFQ
jgi:hypothetical protein